MKMIIMAIFFSIFVLGGDKLKHSLKKSIEVKNKKVEARLNNLDS